MAELEKVIKEWESVLSRDPLDAPWDLIDDTLALLKEQEDLGTELTNAVELIHKKNERIEKLMKEQETHKFFVDESGKITPLPVVVRCKDCKNLGYTNSHWFCKWLNRCVDEDWFCADGERR
jgi:hypothetical protein